MLGLPADLPADLPTDLPEGPLGNCAWSSRLNAERGDLPPGGYRILVTFRKYTATLRGTPYLGPWSGGSSAPPYLVGKGKDGIVRGSRVLLRFPTIKVSGSHECKGRGRC